MCIYLLSLCQWKKTKSIFVTFLLKMYFFRSSCNVSVAKLDRKWWCIRRHCSWSHQGIFWFTYNVKMLTWNIMSHSVPLHYHGNHIYALSSKQNKPPAIWEDELLFEHKWHALLTWSKAAYSMLNLWGWISNFWEEWGKHRKWGKDGKDERRRVGQQGHREEQTNLSPPHW